MSRDFDVNHGRDDQPAPGRQQSDKSGSRSTAQKEEGTRHGRRPAPDAAPAEGAFGQEGHRDQSAERGIGHPGGDARQGED